MVVALAIFVACSVLLAIVGMIHDAGFCRAVSFPRWLEFLRANTSSQFSIRFSRRRDTYAHADAPVKSRKRGRRHPHGAHCEKTSRAAAGGRNFIFIRNGTSFRDVRTSFVFNNASANDKSGLDKMTKNPSRLDRIAVGDLDRNHETGHSLSTISSLNVSRAPRPTP